MRAEPTPGPWATHPDAPNKVFGADGVLVLDTSSPTRTAAECAANAALAGAALEMRDALRALVENPKFDLGAPKVAGRVGAEKRDAAVSAWDGFVADARAALAKAEGRS